MIKVTHITNNPIAGAPINLSLALNKFHGDKIKSRHIAGSDRNENRIYKTDLLTTKNSYEELRKAVHEADVLHFHNFYLNSCDLFHRYPDLRALARRKPRVWQVHSPRDTKWMDIEEGLRDDQAKHLVIGQYHPRQWPECEIVPNIIDITLPEYTPQARKWDMPLRLVFSPSRIKSFGWDSKGYDETYPILVKLVTAKVITAEIIFDRPHAECLEKRSQAHISIDEVVTGSYHLTSLESLAQGLVTIAGLDSQQLKTLKELTGSASHPWLIARPQNLESQIRMVAESPAIAQRFASDARKWMEECWHPKKMTERFVEIYKGLG